MSPDSEPTDAGSATAPGADSPVSRERHDRLLGRGLEDISHLFLSQSADTRAPSDSGLGGGQPREESWSAAPARTSSPPPTGSGTVLLRAGGPLTRNQFAAILKEFDGVLEDGLRSIDTNVPCDPCEAIDVVAADRARRLVIIDFDTTGHDSLLLRGMDHLDWAARNSGNLRRMYPGLDVSQEPRLFLLAPSFSPLLGRVARQLARPQIVWVKFIVADVFGRTGVLFEGVGTDSRQ